MDSMMLQYQNPQDKLVDSIAMNSIGILNANENNHNNNNNNNNSNFLNGPSPQVMLDNTIARDARKILNYKKSFHDDAMFYPDPSINMHQMNGFAANNNNNNNNIPNHANLLNNILMNKQLQMSQGIERNNDSNSTNSNKLLSILANKSLERQQFQFQQQHQQSRRVNSNSGNNNNNSHNNNSHNNITSNNNNIYSNYRSQQGDPYLMN
ncbi:hypothetical protein MOSE0_N01222 [Monosporozyma servazzii]